MFVRFSSDFIDLQIKDGGASHRLTICLYSIGNTNSANGESSWLFLCIMHVVEANEGSSKDDISSAKDVAVEPD